MTPIRSLTRPTAALLAAAMAASFSLTACSSEDATNSGTPSTTTTQPADGTAAAKPESTIEKLRVLTPTTMAFGAPMTGFGEEGHVSDFAQTVDKGNWDSVDQLRSAMINGEVDVAAAPANVAANLYNRGVDIQYIGPVVWGMLFVLGQGADGPEGDWEALRGKKVAVPLPNNMPDLVFTGLLNKNGLSDTDVNIIRVQDPQQAIGMFSQGQVDYAVLPEHVATIAQAKIKKQGAQTYRALNLQEEYAKAFNTSAGFPMAGLIIRKSVAAENPGLVDAIRKEVQASIDKANAGDDATIQAISAHYDLPAEVVKQVIPRLQLKMVPAEEARQDFENFIQFLGENNAEFYGGKLPDDGFYHK